MSHGDQDDLARNYQKMSELELMGLAKEYDGLVDAAQTALREEFRRRGLEPPLVDGEEAIDFEALVTVARYRDMPEAIVARSVLESAGITCFLADENVVRMQWVWSNLIGGMRLQVGAQDEAAARELLSQPMSASFPVDSGTDYEQPTCPNCGSIHVVANDTNRKIKAASTMVGGLPLIVGLPALAFVRGDVWKCNVCGCRWTDDEEPSSVEDQPLR